MSKTKVVIVLPMENAVQFSDWAATVIIGSTGSSVLLPSSQGDSMKKFLPLVLVLTFLLTGCRQKEVPLVQPVQPVPTTLGATSVTTAVTQTIITPLETIEDGQQEVKADESALDLLKRTHTVELKHYSFGDVADSVDGVKGGTDGRYWIFYVNGKMSELGAGEYKIKNGDQIVWKFQKENESL